MRFIQKEEERSGVAFHAGADTPAASEQVCAAGKHAFRSSSRVEMATAVRADAAAKGIMPGHQCFL